MLRRALRLDPSELAPPLDVATIVGLARDDSRARLASLASGALSGVAAAVLLAYGARSLVAVGPVLAGHMLAAGISLGTQLAVALTPAFEVVQQPTVPIGIIAALGFAIAYEYRTRREHTHVYRTT